MELQQVEGHFFLVNYLVKKTAIIALGGNALSQKKEAGTMSEQFNNTRNSFQQIMEFVREDYNICLTHGNGPLFLYLYLFSKLH